MDSCTCRDWMKHGQQKMPDRTPAGEVEDESDESVELELPPAVVRRKVSFADAFGLNLVSVKEYDNRDSSGPGDLAGLLGAEGKVVEEYYLSCPFTCPASDQELRMRLQDQKLELESIELLPGSTTIRGIVRVLNLCFHKVVYVHTTLDGWQSHFDLLAEYMPGSSDGETDRFSFRLMLTTPFEAEGTRVEFCLRYESHAGTFWANNRGTNYIVFCHQRWRTKIKEKEKEREREKLIEENNNRGIRSCLKTNSKVICTEATSGEISEEVAPWTTRTRESTADKITEMTSPKSLKDYCTPLVDRRRKRRTARLANMQDCFSQKQMEPKLVDFSHTIEGTRDWSTPNLSIPNIEDVPIVQSRHDIDTLPILTYHQIPLLSLDWGDNTTSPAYAKPHDGTNPENRPDETQNAHDLVDGISPEVFPGRPDTSNTAAKVKENTRRAVNDTLTFTGIRDGLFTDRQTEGSSEKQDLNKASRLNSSEQMESEFYAGLRGEEEMENLRNDTRCESLGFKESNVCTRNTNVKNSELQKDEERRFEPIREPQGLDVEDELPTLPRIHLSWVGSASSMGGGSSRLLSWWRDFLSLGHVTRALVCSVVLFVIFVTASLCDLPTCLALYLFSLCWWCSQGMKQRLDSAIDVD